jgi:hypothetical protein
LQLDQHAGLGQGLDSVGKSLWVSPVFSTLPPNPILPGDLYRVNIAADTAIPTGASPALAARSARQSRRRRALR